MTCKIINGPWSGTNPVPKPKIRRSDPRIAEEHYACSVCKDTQFILTRDDAITCASCFTPVADLRTTAERLKGEAI